MNPIEHSWFLMKRAINKRKNKPHSIAELKIALLEEWEKLDIDVINSLIDSMPIHVKALMEVKGGTTKH